MTPLFIDTSALVALHYTKDASHKEALNILSKITQQDFKSYISWNIILETITVVSQRVNKKYAIKLLDELKSTTYVVQLDEQLITEGEDIFKSVISKNVSYSDCISFTVMKRYGIEWVFSFDSHFRKQGFKRIGIDGKAKTKLEDLQRTILKYERPNDPVGEKD